MNKLKKNIKSIPILGLIARWFYNLLRINNIKHRVNTLEQKYINLNLENQELKNKLALKDDSYENLVRKHISSQLIYFHEKIDTFIENADEKKAKKLKQSITKDFFDEYYLHFENKFRGSRNSILERYKNYLNFVPFISDSNIENIQSLDIGCGRGEWVQLLQQHGVNAHGIDMNPMMLKLAEENKLKNIHVKDAFEYLKECNDNTFDLITAFHIIEHLPFEKLVNLLEEIKRVSKPNATILLETPNPENLQVAACNFYTDPTHLNPLPANMIKFLVEYIGYSDVEINYLNPNKNVDISPTTAQDYLIVAKGTLSIYDNVKKKLFFDISLYHKNNLRTGIHRVVSEQLKSLEELNQDEYEIIPVYLEQEKQTYRYKKVNENHSILDVTYGDILFSSDLSYSDIEIAKEKGIYESFKEKGAQIVFLVHDILPIQYEEFFVKGTKEKHEKYIQDISSISDLIITTTNAGKKDLEEYLSRSKCYPKIKVLPLGSNISNKNSIMVTKNKSKNIEFSFIMIGTIEPRKAHLQVIEAFDLLWKNETDTNQVSTLTIIGKEGWLVKDTLKRIKEHPLLNKRLFYKDNLNDKELSLYYEKATAIIMASYAEGFGLPLVEAMYYQKPVIARDIKVFREIASDYPTYFEDTKSPEDLANILISFINLKKNKEISSKIINHSYLSWNNHTKKLIQIFKKLS